MRTWTLDDRTTTDITSVGPNVCSTCADLHSQQTQTRHSPPSLPFLKTPEGHPLSLVYQTEDEGDLLQEVVSAGVRLDDRPPLTAGFLLCVCVQSSSVRLRKSDLRRLLLLIASGVQSTMWVSLSVWRISLGKTSNLCVLAGHHNFYHRSKKNDKQKWEKLESSSQSRERPQDQWP